jgi:hypothetical protein
MLSVLWEDAGIAGIVSPFILNTKSMIFELISTGIPLPHYRH